MKRLALAALAILCATSAWAASATFTVTVPAAVGYNIGINSVNLGYGDGECLYADMFMGQSGNGGPWDANTGGAAPLDSTGAPTVAASAGFTAACPTATMTLTWTGAGTVKMVGCSQGATTKNGSNNSAQVTCTQAPTGESNVTGTFYNRVLATPPVTNIHLLLPPAMTNGIFAADFINKTAFFTTYRGMDWFNTVAEDALAATAPSTWSQRTNPNRGSRANTPGGMAYEDMMALGNRAGQGIWLNIPILATDDYVCRLARLLAFGEQDIGDNSSCSPTAPAGTWPITTQPINSTSPIYVEESNETWNYGFPGAVTLNYWGTNGACSGLPSNNCVEPPTGAIAPSAMLATATATATWASLISNGGGYQAGGEAGMFLSYRNATIFKEVFSQLGRASQIRIVLGQQGGCQCNNTWGLTWMNTAANYTGLGMSGNLASWAYAIADAPYFSSSQTTVNAIFTDLSTQMEAGGSMQTLMTYLQTTAASYGLKAVAYESGQSMNYSTEATAAQSDPRMTTIYEEYYTLWNTITGGSLINHYNFVDPWGSSGYWGALPGQQYNCSAKYAALLALTGAAPCTPSQGAMLDTPHEFVIGEK